MRSPAHCLNLPILLLTCMLERDDNGMWKENRNQRLCRMKSQPWKGIVRECLECSRIRRKDGGGGGERRLGIRLNAGGDAIMIKSDYPHLTSYKNLQCFLCMQYCRSWQSVGKPCILFLMPLKQKRRIRISLRNGYNQQNPATVILRMKVLRSTPCCVPEYPHAKT